MVTLVVDRFADGGDGTRRPRAPRGETAPSGTVERSARSDCGCQFANAGPDCYWRMVTGGQLSIDTVDRLPGTVRLVVRGDLDLTTVGHLDAALDKHLRAGTRTLDLDLSGLGFCGAVGLKALATAHRAFQARGGTVTVTGCGRQLRRHLSLTGLQGLLRLG